MGDRCAEVSQCRETRECGGLQLDTGVPRDPCVILHVAGLCEAGSACTSGSCTTERLCVQPPAEMRSSWACTVATRRTRSGPSVLGLLALLAFIRVANRLFVPRRTNPSARGAVS
jgi:hypothetical protein